MIGDFRGFTIVKNKRIKCSINNVRVVYTPDLKCNLFSIQRIESTGKTIVFHDGIAEIIDDVVIVGVGKRNQKLFISCSFFLC